MVKGSGRTGLGARVPRQQQARTMGVILPEASGVHRFPNQKHACNSISLTQHREGVRRLAIQVCTRQAFAGFASAPLVSSSPFVTRLAAVTRDGAGTADITHLDPITRFLGFDLRAYCCLKGKPEKLTRRAWEKENSLWSASRSCARHHSTVPRSLSRHVRELAEGDPLLPGPSPVPA